MRKVSYKITSGKISPSPRDFRGCFDLIRAFRIFSTFMISCPCSVVFDLSLFDNGENHNVEDNARVELYKKDTTFTASLP